MDPNDALKRALAAVTGIKRAQERGEENAGTFFEAYGVELAHQIGLIDSHLRSGGDLPTAWKIRCLECKLYPPACPHNKGERG